MLHQVLYPSAETPNYDPTLLPDHSWHQAQLLPSEGGLGILNAANTYKVAYTASLIDCHPYIQHIYHLATKEFTSDVTQLQKSQQPKQHYKSSPLEVPHDGADDTVLQHHSIGQQQQQDVTSEAS